MEKSHPLELKDYQKKYVDNIKQPKHDHLLKIPFSLFLVGKSNSGKTYIINNLLLNEELYRHLFDHIYVWSMSVHSDKSWLSLMDNLTEKEKEKYTLYDQFDEEKFNEIWDWLENFKKEHKKPFTSLFIFDDILGTSFLKGKNMERLGTRARHLGISYILSSQHYKSVLNIQRENMHGCIITQVVPNEIINIAYDFESSKLYGDKLQKIYNLFKAKNKYNFVYINKQKQPEDQVYMNFTHKIDLDQIK
jgi:hypothetical protein